MVDENQSVAGAGRWSTVDDSSRRTAFRQKDEKPKEGSPVEE